MKSRTSHLQHQCLQPAPLFLLLVLLAACGGGSPGMVPAVAATSKPGSPLGATISTGVASPTPLPSSTPQPGSTSTPTPHPGTTASPTPQPAANVSPSQPTAPPAGSPAPVATAQPTTQPTPMSAATLSPYPQRISTLHVQTADYIGFSPTLTADDPHVFAPYLTWAYTKGDHAGITQAAGVKVIIYTNPIMPGWDNTYEWPLVQGAYHNALATDCNGNVVTTYSGKYRLTNVLNPSVAVPYINADLQDYDAELKSGNPGYPNPYNAIFVDNATEYGASPQPCGNPSQSTWAAGIANTLSQVHAPQPIFLNSLGVWNMPWAAAQQNVLNSPNILGAEFEGCYGSHGWDSAVPGDYVSDIGKDWLEAEYGEINTIAKNKTFWCYSKNTGNAATLISNRIYIYASFLLSYDVNHAIFQTADQTSSTLSVMPETGLVPMYPKTTAPDVSGYAIGGGAYAREYGACYYQGSSIGACAVVVNPGQGTVNIPFTQYAHSVVLNGQGVLDGGSISFQGSSIRQLGPVSAAILTE